MRAAKASHEVDTGDLAITLAEYVPPALTAGTLHAAFRMPQRALTTVVTNVPGPAARARMLDRPMLALYPYVPIANRVRIGVAVTTFGDHAYFGITCDRASVGDADVFAAGIRAGVTELVRAATAARQTRT
jgi:diacylglycerol O-acyltransferase